MNEAEQSLLLSMLEQLRDDFAAERDVSHAGRAAMHRRLDEVSERLARLDINVALSGQADAQLRGEIDRLAGKVDANQAAVAPSIDEWKRIRGLGLGIVGLMTAGGVTLGALVQWGGDNAVNAARAWLHVH
jgi:hypothetical protein